MPESRHFRQPKEGIVLVSVLALLTLLIIIGLAATQSSILSAQINRNSKNQSLAMQTAEAALSIAADRLEQVTSFIAPALGARCLTLAGQKFVVARSSYEEIWRQPDAWVPAANRPLPCGMPVYFVPIDWPHVTTAPRYIMEYMTVFALPQAAEHAAISVQAHRVIFRITALGSGAKAQSTAKIQALYSRDFAINGGSLTDLKRLAWRQVID